MKPSLFIGGLVFAVCVMSPAGAWSADDARRIATMICADNARRAYGLDGA